ncbi:TetR family transcriptional regulator [Tamaricihabitans halophyticus]|uniref:TetR family transcriptional regulator n=2 Tax=Tamaricihabitans halophyticus TaxID=1262583 RepID=A0A4V2SSX2_9PSEU|nr:TetR family transcriptional regulator [Tamaricihabitans halophyticus]
MTPDQRRQAIIDATVPLLLEHGGNVTTGQIAEAAGIAEGTVFRAFTDKRELLVACARHETRHDEVEAQLALIDPQLALREQLTIALSVVDEHLHRAWSLLHVLHAAGVSRAEIAGEVHSKRSGDKPERFGGAISAVARLLERKRADLRLAPEAAARILLSLIVARRAPGEPQYDDVLISRDQLVEIFLHGTIHNGQGTD